MANPEDNDHQITEAVGSATASKNIEVTIDWDTMISEGLSGQLARNRALDALRKIEAYIEGAGKFNVNA